jgi:hypothetical protein
VFGESTKNEIRGGGENKKCANPAGKRLLEKYRRRRQDTIKTELTQCVKTGTPQKLHRIKPTKGFSAHGK